MGIKGTTGHHHRHHQANTATDIIITVTATNHGHLDRDLLG